jgi:hypothetical protein
MLEAIDILLDTYFSFGFHNGSPVRDSLSGYDVGPCGLGDRWGGAMGYAGLGAVFFKKKMISCSEWRSRCT